MREIVEVSVADLLLDEENARFRDSQSSQQQACLALAKVQGGRALVKLAEDIVTHGLDPTNPPIIVPTSDSRKRYRVIEGNRRVLALKALETPALVSSALTPAQQSTLARLSARYANDPLDTIECTLFEDVKSAVHWIDLRHSGFNEGAGLMSWGSEEKDRFRERHGGDRQARHARQIIDFLEDADALHPHDDEGSRKILSNVVRLFSTPDVREAYGIEYTQGGVQSHFSHGETVRALSAVVNRFIDGTLRVGQIYSAEDRRNFARALRTDERPDPSARLQSVTPLEDLPKAGKARATRKGRGQRPPRRRVTTQRTSLIPPTCNLNVPPPRLNRIYSELLDMSAQTYPNACAVLFRVFVELSVDHYIADKKVMPDRQMNAAKFSEKLRKTGEHLHAAGKITQAVKRMVDTAASGRGPLASTYTMHQYVHNPHVLPQPSELQDAWDELQPLMEKIWR